ncbi:hypothetical protein [Streptomyces sp. B6B3]
MERVELVVAELAANAVFHGQVGGRGHPAGVVLHAPPGVVRRRGHSWTR